MKARHLAVIVPGIVSTSIVAILFITLFLPLLSQAGSMTDPQAWENSVRKLEEQGRETFEQGVREDKEHQRHEAERAAEEQRQQTEQDMNALERAAEEQREQDIDEFERRSEEQRQLDRQVLQEIEGT